MGSNIGGKNVDQDAETGKLQPTYDREAFTQAVRETDGAVGTQDVADAVGCSYELAYKRLREFEQSGDVESQKVANTRIWDLAND
jgi:hypothetical protein